MHSAAVATGEARSLEDFVFRSLDEAQIRARPHGLNSLAWLFWHMARCEDVAVNIVLAGRPQVFDEGWAERLIVQRRDVGTGMTAEDVADLSARVDIGQLRAYRAAVGRRTREVAQALRPEEWEETVDATAAARAVAAGAFGPDAGWLERLWTGKSKAWLLHTLAVGHNSQHLGQARWIRKLVTGKGQV